MPLRQLLQNDFGAWVFQKTENIIWEQAVHPFSQIYELLGPVRDMTVLRRGKHETQSGNPFFDKWEINMDCERGVGSLSLSVGDVFPNEIYTVTCQDGMVTADLAKGTIETFGKTPMKAAWERYADAKRNGSLTIQHERKNLTEFCLSLVRLAKPANAFVDGMTASISAFHKAFRAGMPVPCSGVDGVRALEFCDLTISAFPPSAPKVEAEVLTAREPEEGDTLVTGALGFIGTPLVEKLLEEGKPVRIMVRGAHRTPKRWLKAGVAVVEGDIADAEAVSNAVKGTKVVYHLATGGQGKSFDAFQQSMVGGCRNVANACLEHGVARLIFTSTIAALYLGEVDDPPVTGETPTDPIPEGRSFYSRAKALCEAALNEMRDKKGLKVTIFRPGVVVGENGIIQHSGLGKWIKDTQCLGWGFGKTSVPFVLVEDVVSAMVKADSKAASEGKTYNLVGGVSISASEYVSELAKKTGRPFEFHPRSLFKEQSIVWFKWLGKHLARFPTRGKLPSYRELKSKSVARPFDISDVMRDLDWAPENDREVFMQKAVGWYTEGVGHHPSDAETVTVSSQES